MKKKALIITAAVALSLILIIAAILIIVSSNKKESEIDTSEGIVNSELSEVAPSPLASAENKTYIDKLSFDEQLELFASNYDSWMDKDDVYSYVSVSDADSDGILEFYVKNYQKTYSKSTKLYKHLYGDDFQLVSETSGELPVWGDKDGFSEKVNRFDGKYYSVITRENYYGMFNTKLVDVNRSPLSSNAGDNGIGFYAFVHDNGDVDVQYTDSDWKYTDKESYENWEKSLAGDFGAIETLSYSWKKITDKSDCLDLLKESLSDFVVESNHYAGTEDRLSILGGNVNFLGYIEYDSFKNPTMYALAEYADSFKEGEMPDIKECGIELLYSTVCAMGEDALTQDIISQSGGTVVNLRKVDKSKFDEFFTDVYPVSSLEDCYAAMTEAPNDKWNNLHEMGVYYSKDDNCIYAYMLAIGYYSQADVYLNEPYKDGYIVKFISGDMDLNLTISKETSIYYVPSNNSFGYEIKSIESENNKLNN